MYAKDLKTTCGVRDAKVNFAIESTGSTKGWVD
jgi:hypothetical protein